MLGMAAAEAIEPSSVLCLWLVSMIGNCAAPVVLSLISQWDELTVEAGDTGVSPACQGSAQGALPALLPANPSVNDRRASDWPYHPAATRREAGAAAKQRAVAVALTIPPRVSGHCLS